MYVSVLLQGRHVVLQSFPPPPQAKFKARQEGVVGGGARDHYIHQSFWILPISTLQDSLYTEGLLGQHACWGEHYNVQLILSSSLYASNQHA